MNEEQSLRSRRRSRAEAEELVGAYEASGLSRREFCKQNGLSLNTLNRYCGRRRARTEPASGNWIEVEVSGTAAGTASNGSGLALHLGDNRRIEVRRGFDAGTLEQLLRVLERV